MATGDQDYKQGGLGSIDMNKFQHNPQDIASNQYQAQVQGFNQYPKYPHPAPCPSCGHCPTCGRGGYNTYPYYQQPTPMWSGGQGNGTITVSTQGQQLGYK